MYEVEAHSNYQTFKKCWKNALKGAELVKEGGPFFLLHPVFQCQTFGKIGVTDGYSDKHTFSRQILIRCKLKFGFKNKSDPRACSDYYQGLHSIF